MVGIVHQQHLEISRDMFLSAMHDNSIKLLDKGNSHTDFIHVVLTCGLHQCYAVANNTTHIYSKIYRNLW